MTANHASDASAAFLILLLFSCASAHAPGPVAKDVFMSAAGGMNLLIFRRDDAGYVTEPIERRRFNGLRLTREQAK